MVATLSEVSADFQKCSEDGSKFPLILVPSGAAKDAESLANALRGEQQKYWFDSLLVKHGAVLLRGFEVWTPQQMDMVVSTLNWKEYPYMELAGAAARTRVCSKILTANETVPLHQPLGYHNEAVYAVRTPMRLFFFCEKPPAPGTGGATPIVLGNVVYKRVCENVELANKIVGRLGCWVRKFTYKEKESAETEARKSGIELQRLPDDQGFVLPLKNFGVLAPVFREDRAGRMAMFSSLGLFALMNKIRKENYVYLFEDGSEIGQETMDELMQIMREEGVCFPWERGDILVLDNSAVLHSREPCTSLDRSILVALVEN